MIVRGLNNITFNRRYFLSENTGTTVYDFGSEKQNGTNNGATIDQTGYRGKCYLFDDAAGDYIDTPSRSYSGITSVCAWIKPDASGIYLGIFGVPGAANPLWARITDSNVAQILIKQSDSTNKVVTGTTVISTSEWTHVALVADGSFLRLYINGIADGTPTAYDGTIYAGSFNFYIGDVKASYQPFSGYIQDVCLIDSALSSEEVKDIVCFGFNQTIFVNPNKKLKIWNKLRRSAETLKSILGSSFVEGASITYNDGISLGATGVLPANTAYIPSGSIADLTKLTVEFIYTHNASFSGTTNFARIIHYSAGTGNFIQCFVRSDTYKIVVAIFNTASNYIQYEWNFADMNAIDAYFELASAGGDGAAHHYSLTIDISEAQVLSFYKDNISLGAQDVTSTGGSLSSPVALDENLYLGVHQSTNTQGLCGIIKQIKISNYAETDFSHYQIEYPIKVNGTNFYTTPLEQIILWNKIGSTSESNNSPIGFNLTESGTILYGADKFGNGVYTNVNTNGLLTEQYLSIEKGFIEFWWKPGAVPASEATNIFFGVASSVYPMIYAYYTPTGTDFWFTIRPTSGKYIRIAIDASVAGYTSAGQLIHIAMVWDASVGSGTITNASDVISIYIDGVKMTVFANDSNTGSTQYSDLQGAIIADELQLLGTPLFSTSACPSPIDNIKIGSYAKTDFSDKDVQEPIDLQKVVTI